MLKTCEIVELPTNGVRHNFGNSLGIVKFEKGVTEHLSDEIAEIAIKAKLPYFKKKEAKVEAAKAEVAKG